MKVLILGYDALEYDLVEKYDLKQLKQEEYGAVEINTGVLSTPTVWTSFITGLLPKEHQVFGFKWKKINKLQRLAIFFRLNRIIETSPFLSKNIGEFLDHPTLRGDFTSIRGRFPTIFDYAQLPLDVSVPCYSANMSTYQELRKLMAEALGNPIAEKQVLKRAWQVFKEKRKDCLDRLGGYWDLFMVHFFLPDVVQHLRWYREEEIKGLYKELDETTRLFKDRINDEEETLVLINSDHGQKRGLHTPYGFYSCNKRLHLENPKITDFADVIRARLGVPTPHEIQKIKTRLKSLGY